MASFAPEVIAHIARFPVTNTVLNTLLIDTILIGSTFYLKNHLKIIPNTFQNITELILETFNSFIESVAGKNTPKVFPYVMTFFLFIILSNWSGLIPGMSAVGFFVNGGSKRTLVPLFRNATSDTNVTFALAIISAVATHVLSVRTLGIKEYLSRYFSLNPINLFVGILEIISEFTKIVSLSFRLFGNIYAGEVVLSTVSSMFVLLFPIPFMMLEVIVGFVQALVFSLLTMAFMAILMTPHHEGEHAAKEVIHA